MSIKDKIKELGMEANFSLAQYVNPLDEQGTRRARQVTTAFLEGFATYCKDNGFEFSSGMDEFEVIGMASYLAVKHKDDDTLLMMLLTPHDLVDINNTDDNEGEDEDD